MPHEDPQAFQDAEISGSYSMNVEKRWADSSNLVVPEAFLSLLYTFKHLVIQSLSWLGMLCIWNSGCEEQIHHGCDGSPSRATMHSHERFIVGRPPTGMCLEFSWKPENLVGNHHKHWSCEAATLPAVPLCHSAKHNSLPKVHYGTVFTSP